MRRLLVLVAAAGLGLAGSGVATAAVNSIASSTMHFHGSLTDAGGGVYTGSIDATPGTYYMPGGPGTAFDGSDWRTPDGRLAVGGWDVYAKEGGSAYYDDVFKGIIGPDHDAYHGPGGWGAFWTPDVPDWEHYQLTLTAGNWYLEYKGAALGTPMSGAMNWSTMFASEDDTGSYRGTVPADPDANDGGAATMGGGAQAWDMDWTWGSEAIPLEYPGFAVTLNDLGGGVYDVALTPAIPEPASIIVWSLLGGLGLAIGWRRRRKAA